MAFKKVRPMPNEKVERNQELYQYKIDNPKTTFRELGKKFEISGARAYYLFKMRKAEIEAEDNN